MQLLAESELNGSGVEPKTDIEKLICIRGWRKGDFTKSELKIDLMLSRSIPIAEQLCEAEALLANLKNLLELSSADDAEITLLIEVEDDLSAEIESNPTFDEKASISIAL